MQEARKQRSGRSLTEDAREESADKKRGIFFSWSRNRSFGKGPKKKDIGDINLGETNVQHKQNTDCWNSEGADGFWRRAGVQQWRKLSCFTVIAVFDRLVLKVLSHLGLLIVEGFSKDDRTLFLL